MKIVFISRSSLYTNKGGDTIQIRHTALWLEKIGIEVDIRLCHEKIDYKAYDLLHFFNIIRPADILHHARLANKPYVVSTIYVDYSEFDRKIRGGLSGFLFRILPSGLIEYLKVMARRVFNNEKLISPEYLFLGHSRSIRKVLQNAALLLPNSMNEYKRLAEKFSPLPDYRIIPNAIDPSIFTPGEPAIKENGMVLCVARLEGLKNQLNLIRALNDTGYELYIIGARSTNQSGYYEKCRKEARHNIHFIDALPQHELVHYYQRARVHVLPSWFETTGLSSLEAAAMGCNIVVSDRGAVRDYFGDLAYYCDPASPASIKDAIDAAAGTGPNPELIYKVSNEYTWQIAAIKTAEAYNTVLSKYTS